jgi:prevent-host-death family protein
MKVNMLEAKSQLSRLVEAALGGEEVLIARNGAPMVRLVPVAPKDGLAGWGSLRKLGRKVDLAFTPEVDAEVLRMLEDRR